MHPFISLKNVAVRYRRSGNLLKRKSYFEALKSVSLDIYPGETLGILGRNGSGKSTLLKIISGVIRPDSGTMTNYGASVSLLALQSGFDHNLSGHDNAILGGILRGLPRSKIEAQLDKIQEYSELGGFFFEPVRTYSTGMCARLGFSIANCIQPDVLLIDEVLGVGDQNFRNKAERTMALKIQSNQTVVFVSHSEAQISRLCDRAILIEDGVSFASGSPDDVLKIYNGKFKNPGSNTPSG